MKFTMLCAKSGVIYVDSISLFDRSLSQHEAIVHYSTWYSSSFIGLCNQRVGMYRAAITERSSSSTGHHL